MDKKICQTCKYYGGKKYPKCAKKGEYVARKGNCGEWEKKK